MRHVFRTGVRVGFLAGEKITISVYLFLSLTFVFLLSKKLNKEQAFFFLFFFYHRPQSQCKLLKSKKCPLILLHRSNVEEIYHCFLFKRD